MLRPFAPPAPLRFLPRWLMGGVLALAGCKGLDVVPIFSTDTCPWDGEELGSREVDVERTLDGDTFDTTEGESVRLLGINAPEIEHPDQAEECWGPESADWLAEQITGQTVELLFDSECTDMYGRTLAYVYAASTGGGSAFDTSDTADSGTPTYDIFINEASVREGESIVFEAFDDIKLAAVLYDAQAVAEREGAGLWGVGTDCNPAALSQSDSGVTPLDLGCACSTGGSGFAGAAPVLGGIALLLRRRRDVRTIAGRK